MCLFGKTERKKKIYDDKTETNNHSLFDKTERNEHTFEHAEWEAFMQAPRRN